MNTHTASLGTGGTLGFQGTLSTYLFRKMDHATRNKRHLLLGGTLDGLSFPVQVESLLVEVLAVAHLPGFAIDLQVRVSCTHQTAALIRSVDVQFFQSNLLLLQIFADRFGDTRFRGIGWRDSYCSNEAGIQIMKHMAFVSTHTHAAALPSMPHLSIFDTDASIFGHSFDEVSFPVLIDLHILFSDLLGNFQGRLSQFYLILLQSLHPGFHGLQRVQDQAQRLFSLSNLIPITIEDCFQT